MKSFPKGQGAATGDVYDFVGRLVTEHTGVQLGAKQRPMVESRLQKRLSLLNIADPADYFDYFHANKEVETSALIALLTTHHTYFFREFTQFEFLSDTALDLIIAGVRARKEKVVRVWSAACSYGQEVYSLAMFLDYHLKIKAPDLSFEILGTDVDPEAVKVAANGVYRYSELKEAPMQYVADHWVKGTGDVADFVKIKAKLRDKCRFHVANLVALKPQGLNQNFDVIFCRNVFIYFTPAQVRLISTELLKRLAKNGYLFVGVSEGLHGMDMPLKTVSSSVYQDKNVPDPAPRVLHTPGTERRKTLRVICVDDSPSVLMVLKRLLSKERGFEVVGTATNGLEAKELLKSTSCDLMTLDIHMPEMNGVEYLKANYHPAHPPVVMVTSVSRDDAGLATQALTLGASDYIEKPSLNNMNEVGEQLCTKLRTAFKTREAGPKGPTTVDVDFRREVKVTQPQNCLRVVAGAMADLVKVKILMNQCQADPTPVVFLLSGYTDAQRERVWTQVFPADTQRKAGVLPAAGPLPTGGVFLLDAVFGPARLAEFFRGKTVTAVMVGVADLKLFNDLCAKNPQQLLVEELPENLKITLPAFADRVPLASLAFNSIEFLSRVK